jgi:hypothetical protein
MTRHVLGVLAFVIALTRTGMAQQSAPARADSMRVTAVTYISGQSVYVGVGRADGVREGTAFDVLRGGEVIATLKAAFLSSHSASCELVSNTTMPVVGDSVRYRPTVEATTVAAADSSPGTEAPRRTAPWRRPVRGHIGIRFLGISQPNISGSAALTQPSAEVYVEANRLGGTPLGFVIDGRGRRTIGGSSTLGVRDGQTFVYQASVSLAHEGSGTRLSVGRQYSPALASVSLFDGAIAELNQPRWSLGAFSGVQPDVATMNYSTEIRESGGYLQIHNVPDGSLPWSFTTGGVTSSDLGQLNREFAFAQAAATSGFVSLYATQEVDFNRGWKRAAGEPAFSPTSTFATLLVRVTDELSLQGGVDNRRSVRLYRDYISPETEFDDAFREGVWAGASMTFARRIRISADARQSHGGIGGDAAYYTGSFGVSPVTSLGVEAHLRSTSYRTNQTTGWLHSCSVGVSSFGLAHIEVNGGLRTQQLVDTASTILLPLANTRWIGASVDVSLGRSWYVIVSGSRDGSGVELTNQAYASLVFRF